MVQRGTIKTGDFVIVTESFHSYAKTGDIFRLIDGMIPGEETSALGWLFNKELGIVKNNMVTDKAYKLPHDKIALMGRPQLAKLMQAALMRLQRKKEAADLAYQLEADRINGYLNDSEERQVRKVMEETFYFI